MQGSTYSVSSRLPAAVGAQEGRGDPVHQTGFLPAGRQGFVRCGRLAMTIFCFSVFLTLSSSAFAASIAGDVRLIGKKPRHTTPAPVAYQGPCGIKYPASVVRLWKNRVTDVTIWLTSKQRSNENVQNTNISGWNCEFRPKMLPVKPGSEIRIANEDQNTQWIVIEESGAKKRQEMLASGEKPVELTIKENSNVHILSGFYPWMEAWIRSVPDLFATTSTIWDGRFFFKDIPDGEYTLFAWHPSLGETSKEVAVAGNKNQKIEIKFDRSDRDNNVPVIEASKLEELFGGDKSLDEDPFKKK